MSHPIIAIDGPAGAGKSSVARALAERLGFFLLDTGALYRSLALLARERGVGWDDGAALGRLAGQMQVEFGRGPDGGRVFLEGRDVSAEIRTPEVSLGASHVSLHPEVRAALLPLQRRLAAAGPCVVEGRDVGTVVLPQAPVKFFLTASEQVRARRRYQELRARGVEADPGLILREQQERDRRDQTRSEAPLRPADDALIVDTSDLPLQGVVDRLERICRERLGL